MLTRNWNIPVLWFDSGECIHFQIKEDRNNNLYFLIESISGIPHSFTTTENVMFFNEVHKHYLFSTMKHLHNNTYMLRGDNVYKLRYDCAEPPPRTAHFMEIIKDHDGDLNFI